MKNVLTSGVIAATGLFCALTATNTSARNEMQSDVVAPCVAPNRSEVRIPGGTLLVRSENGDVVRRVEIAPFMMDRFDVTNAEFGRFVAATKYVTDAERKPAPSEYPEIPAHQLAAGGAVFTPTTDNDAMSTLDWWRFMPGANWRHPYGPGSSIVGHEHEPVVQVSYNDALAYARWAGRELPTEEQYEYAARGGLVGQSYAWGNEMTPGGKWMANTWQGEFPNAGIADDGFLRAAPVGCFPPNGYGLYDIVGNVWKWTSTLSSHSTTPTTSKWRATRVIKGGSFMCSSSYCMGFHVAARQSQESGFSSMHLGFRTVRRAPK